MSIYDDVEAAAELVVRIANHMIQPDEWGRTVMDRLRDAKNGHPKASRCDTDRVSASGISDPTGNAAMLPDVAADHERQLIRLMRQVRRDADMATTLLAIYSSRAPTELERSRTADDNTPRCESCCRVEIAKRVPWHVEPHHNGTGYYRTTAGGALTDPVYLCRWCRDHAIDRGCLPSTDELEQHRDGRRIRCPHPVVADAVDKAS